MLSLLFKQKHVRNMSQRRESHVTIHVCVSWLQSVPKHLKLQDAFRWQVPPPVLGLANLHKRQCLKSITSP